MSQVSKQSYFKTVNSSSEDALELVIPNGEVWEIDSWSGSANPFRDTHSCLIWDFGGAGERILALTYTSLKTTIQEQFIGDGVKKLALVLRNDSLSAERLGCEFIYRIIE
jgi:hypothetical protein